MQVRSLGQEDALDKCHPSQYSWLENPMDGGAGWATVHGVAKSRTRLSDFTHSLTHSNYIELCICSRLSESSILINLVRLS